MKTVRTGIVGLGRLGQKYAEKPAHQKCPMPDLFAACSINEAELAYARDTLRIDNTYSDLDEMLATEALDALFIISSTDQHATHFY